MKTKEQLELELETMTRSRDEWRARSGNSDVNIENLEGKLGYLTKQLEHLHKVLVRKNELEAVLRAESRIESSLMELALKGLELGLEARRAYVELGGDTWTTKERAEHE